MTNCSKTTLCKLQTHPMLSTSRSHHSLGVSETGSASSCTSDFIVENTTLNFHSGTTMNHQGHQSNHQTMTEYKTTISLDLRNFTDNNNTLTGVIVNGFHPQLCSWEKSNELTYSLKRGRSDTSMDANINSKVARMRNETLQEIKDGDRVGANHLEKAHLTTTTECQDRKSPLTVYFDLFERSNVPQLIAAPGGRIAAVNEKFMYLFGRRSFESLTVFDVVQPSMIPKLYEIFLLALQPHTNEDKVCDVKDDDQGMYQSLTVPCANVESINDRTHYITFSLMYDEDPSKRCFHCIVTTKHDMPIGTIYQVSRQELLGLL